MLFLCPKCKKKLDIDGARAVCPLGHSYDRCRAGYYNLLLSNKSSSHGDNRSMVEARRAFLGMGYYRPLADLVSSFVSEHTKKCPVVLDAGAGEGYYTDVIERALYERDGETSVSAFDISKDAVREIGKKNPRISLAVAGSYSMPVGDGTVDALINIFSPLALSETVRVLSEGGIFIMAIPDAEHLFELKAAIYDTPYKNTVNDTALEGLKLIDERELRYNMSLDNAGANALFKMTPYAYRTSPECAARINALEHLDCTAHFRVLVYKKG